MYSAETRMNCILTNTKDIYFHLAAEEYLLKNRNEDFFLLWQSDPCVVVGKHQNAMAEINHLFLREHNIAVARRLTGGGTVYHDAGNLNFTFIMNGEKGKLVDFQRHLKPVIEFLHSKNIIARAGTKNEINVNGLKISGNAEHVFKDRVLHHGTLLFHTDLEILRKSIQVKPDLYIDKAVQSNRTEVINLSEFLDKKETLEKFKNDFSKFIKASFPLVVDYRLSDEESEEIKALRDAKYSQWEWIYGYSPVFEIRKKISFRNQTLELYLLVKNGLIEKADLKNMPFGELVDDLIKILPGKRFEYDDIRSTLANIVRDEGIIDLIMESIF